MMCRHYSLVSKQFHRLGRVCHDYFRFPDGVLVRMHNFYAIIVIRVPDESLINPNDMQDSYHFKRFLYLIKIGNW